MNSNSSAGGGSAGGGSAGGGRILSSIGINLSPRTREVAGDQIRCQRAVQFYEFLKTEGTTFANVPFVDVPTVTVQREGFFKVVSNQQKRRNTHQLPKHINLENIYCNY